MKRVVAAQDGTSDVTGAVETKKLKTEDGAEAIKVLELDEHSFECVICFDLLVDPVVGRCGHDFCKSCIEEWLRKQSSATCPSCREPLGHSSRRGTPGFGVCIRLKELIEKLFPRRSKQRRQEVEKEEKAKAEERAAEAAASAAAAAAASASAAQQMAYMPMAFAGPGGLAGWNRGQPGHLQQLQHMHHRQLTRLASLSDQLSRGDFLDLRSNPGRNAALRAPSTLPALNAAEQAIAADDDRPLASLLNPGPEALAGMFTRRRAASAAAQAAAANRPAARSTEAATAATDSRRSAAGMAARLSDPGDMPGWLPGPGLGQLDQPGPDATSVRDPARASEQRRGGDSWGPFTAAAGGSRHQRNFIPLATSEVAERRRVLRGWTLRHQQRQHDGAGTSAAAAARGANADRFPGVYLPGPIVFGMAGTSQAPAPAAAAVEDFAPVRAGLGDGGDARDGPGGLTYGFEQAGIEAGIGQLDAQLGSLDQYLEDNLQVAAQAEGGGGSTAAAADRSAVPVVGVAGGEAPGGAGGDSGGLGRAADWWPSPHAEVPAEVEASLEHLLRSARAARRLSSAGRRSQSALHADQGGDVAAVRGTGTQRGAVLAGGARHGNAAPAGAEAARLEAGAAVAAANDQDGESPDVVRGGNSAAAAAASLDMALGTAGGLAGGSAVPMDVDDAGLAEAQGEPAPGRSNEGTAAQYVSRAMRQTAAAAEPNRAGSTNRRRSRWSADVGGGAAEVRARGRAAPAASGAAADGAAVGRDRRAIDAADSESEDELLVHARAIAAARMSSQRDLLERITQIQQAHHAAATSRMATPADVNARRGSTAQQHNQQLHELLLFSEEARNARPADAAQAAAAVRPPHLPWDDGSMSGGDSAEDDWLAALDAASNPAAADAGGPSGFSRRGSPPSPGSGVRTAAAAIAQGAARRAGSGRVARAAIEADLLRAMLSGKQDPARGPETGTAALGAAGEGVGGLDRSRGPSGISRPALLRYGHIMSGRRGPRPTGEGQGEVAWPAGAQDAAGTGRQQEQQQEDEVQFQQGRVRDAFLHAFTNHAAHRSSSAARAGLHMWDCNVSGSRAAGGAAEQQEGELHERRRMTAGRGLAAGADERLMADESYLTHQGDLGGPLEQGTEAARRHAGGSARAMESDASRSARAAGVSAAQAARGNAGIDQELDWRQQLRRQRLLRQSASREGHQGRHQQPHRWQPPQRRPHQVVEPAGSQVIEDGGYISSGSE
eukprot:gene11149-11301_t